MRSAKNLLDETLEALTLNGKSPSDVLWCGSTDFCFTWEDFKAVAERTNYNAGYGGQEVAVDLVIVGDGWWLERAEYDGGEWWEFKSLPERPSEFHVPVRLADGHGSWSSLEDIQK